MRQVALNHLACRSLQPPRPWLLFPESGMQGVEFAGRSVDVIEVEPQQQRDPAVLVEADQAKHLVLRCTGAHIRGAHFHSCESKAVTPNVDDHVAVTHHA